MLEAEQGRDVKFIKPEVWSLVFVGGGTCLSGSELTRPWGGSQPCFVVKTSLVQTGAKVFVNICQSDAVAMPTEVEARRWAVPSSTSKPRDDRDRS